MSIDNIFEEFDSELIKKELNLIIKDTINKKTNHFEYVLPKLLKDIIRKIIVDIIKEKAHNNFKERMESLIERIKEEVDNREMIEEKIKSFSLITLEKLVLDIAEQELKHIEYRFYYRY